MMRTSTVRIDFICSREQAFFLFPRTEHNWKQKLCTRHLHTRTLWNLFWIDPEIASLHLHKETRDPAPLNPGSQYSGDTNHVMVWVNTVSDGQVVAWKCRCAVPYLNCNDNFNFCTFNNCTKSLPLYLITEGWYIKSSQCFVDRAS
jgi:hypothetical protein